MTNLSSRVSPYWLWALLSIPAILMLWNSVTSEDARVIHKLLHPSGETSARLLIITMMATPLNLLLKGWRGPLWLKKNRRYIGVAAFCYALLHAVYYVIGTATLQRMLNELSDVHIWTGWLAFAIFIPLAVTSMDYFVRNMGTGWKRLQRWTYPAAVLTLVHWAAFHNWESPTGAIVHFTPLVLLEIYRVWYWYGRPRKQVEIA